MRILYLFPDKMHPELDRVNKGDAPSERMYGLVELRRSGHQVELSDSRWQGRIGRFRLWLKHYDVNLSDLRTIMAMRRYDVVVVKDDLSLILTLAALLVGTKIVYLDSLFIVPRRRWRKLAYQMNFKLAHGIVIYCRSQIDAWGDYFSLSPQTPKVLPYTIDLPFYRTHGVVSRPARDYVLSIGRDPGRDFPTLVEAARDIGMDLKIITLPYLLKGIDLKQPYLQVLERLSYEELFKLYAGARFVVIPLKKGVTYPSGVRALLEAMALEKAVICSRTPVLEEYAKEGEGVTYVEPENISQLRNAMQALARDDTAITSLGRQGRQMVQARYSMEAFTSKFEQYLNEVVNSGK